MRVRSSVHKIGGEFGGGIGIVTSGDRKSDQAARLDRTDVAASMPAIQPATDRPMASG